MDPTLRIPRRSLHSLKETPFEKLRLAERHGDLPCNSRVSGLRLVGFRDQDLGPLGFRAYGL